MTYHSFMSDFLLEGVTTMARASRVEISTTRSIGNPEMDCEIV